MPHGSPIGIHTMVDTITVHGASILTLGVSGCTRTSDQWLFINLLTFGCMDLLGAIHDFDHLHLDPVIFLSSQ